MAHILVIDDDAFFREFLGRLLAAEGHETARAASVAEADGLARAAEFDLVFLDVRLPDGSGLDLLPRLRVLPSEPEVIIITGAGDPDGAELAILSGAWDYIEKSASQEALRLACLRALRFREKKQDALPVRRPGIIGGGPAMERALRQLGRAARSQANVLLVGETGTGKELFARAIHDNSSRAKADFVIVDCAGLQETIMASELFGHRRGAFTGASGDKPGLLARADGGTLFLDEISELSLEMQKGFLRLLEGHTYRPLGENREIQVDFRLVCASNRDLAAMVAAGTFREDLFYRIRAVTITPPPLREMADDLPDIAEFHLTRICRAGKLPLTQLSGELLELFAGYDWPGNVRELVHVLEALMTAAPLEPELLPSHLPREARARLVRSRAARARPAKGPTDPGPLCRMIDAPSDGAHLDWESYKRQAHDRVERAYLEHLLGVSGGDVRTAMNRSGLSQSRLYGLLRKHGLTLR
ncbi:sigma-54-dependent transcriptional regulator [Desulfovibrio sp. TomC]|uniref:sigma-54-dependent transcriptional regulator n=1 Tax=Desulfovibrio sp. TomC TaxID=1562888 RepID=UPI0005755F6A|nr:sigma-54 dependent transcriptional regulator [Desulfovibrio sp. TomC]KHK03308.1 Sigma-54 dependent DNA-binding response regulator [Desulfovibrio sp. TomC]